MSLSPITCPYELEPELREQLSHRAGHQRCLEGHDEVLLIVREVPRQAGSEGEALFFWRRHDGRWFQPGGPGMSEMGQLLERYAGAVETHEKVVNEACDAAETFLALRHAGPLARSIRDLARALEQALAVDPADRSIRGFRDRAREIERAAEFLQADARATLEFLRTQQGESLARSAEKLVKAADRLGWLAGVIALAVILGVSLMLPVVWNGILWGVAGVWLVIAATQRWRAR